jgi:hypothetical protein
MRLIPGTLRSGSEQLLIPTVVSCGPVIFLKGRLYIVFNFTDKSLHFRLKLRRLKLI